MVNIIPQSSIPLATTTVGTTGSLLATIGTSAFLGRNIYLTGFTYQSSGATGASTVTLTVAYAPTGSGAFVVIGQWSYMVGTGATTVQVPLDINLIPPMQSMQSVTGATNSTTTTPVGTISISATAAGAGATFAAINAWGYAL